MVAKRDVQAAQVVHRDVTKKLRESRMGLVHAMKLLQRVDKMYPKDGRAAESMLAVKEVYDMFPGLEDEMRRLTRYIRNTYFDR